MITSDDTEWQYKRHKVSDCWTISMKLLQIPEHKKQQIILDHIVPHQFFHQLQKKVVLLLLPWVSKSAQPVSH